MRILFIGDVVGRTGRTAVSEYLPGMIRDWSLDLVIVNGENSAGGFGITEAIYQELLDAGASLLPLADALDPRARLRGQADLRDVVVRGLPGEHLVEVRTGVHKAVVGETTQFRPREFEGVAAADYAQALGVQPTGLLAGVDTHSDHLLDRPRRQPVAADFVARKRRLLQQCDRQSGLGQVVGRGRARRARTDDDDVGMTVGTCEAVHEY